MSLIRRMFGLATATLAVAALTVQPRPTAAAEPIVLETQCFDVPGITECLADDFLAYWKNNGGLPVFGYPITEAADEYNVDSDADYWTQWLERNRFELHPENAGTPYEVLLGLLGKERLAQLGRDAEPREAGPVDGCLWFEETGHNVCDQASNLGFKSYWQSHGLKIDGLDTYARSLQLFGLPLTSAQTETNANGDTVVTQWFERARLEWHPSNPDEFKVLLGLLGKEIIDEWSQPVTPEQQCENTPDPRSANIRPSKCVQAGTVLFFDFYGFQPNEEVILWITDPAGETYKFDDGTSIGATGSLENAEWPTDGSETGLWLISLEGKTSKHIADVFFTVLP
ncbi:hypothetical protein [Herpetosiphon geysericola]|uniref:hypothetical protein n=1 Tax=Herpetosiphon geysericola TaxID=70996 RepID=UPI000A972B86|nr:hypothetical protein [Herpetosiphon geysericola]